MAIGAPVYLSANHFYSTNALDLLFWALAAYALAALLDGGDLRGGWPSVYYSGTRRYYSARREGLADLRRYIEALWDDVLAAYAADDPAPPSGGSRLRRGGRT